MRRVIVKIQPDYRKPPEPVGEAWFHRFGVDFIDFDAGPGNFSVAIVEWDDGRVELVPAHLIQFVEPLNGEAP